MLILSSSPCVIRPQNVSDRALGVEGDGVEALGGLFHAEEKFAVPAKEVGAREMRDLLPAFQLVLVVFRGVAAPRGVPVRWVVGLAEPAMHKCKAGELRHNRAAPVADGIAGLVRGVGWLGDSDTKILQRKTSIKVRIRSSEENDKVIFELVITYLYICSISTEGNC
jgi:hypothetical protein